MKKYHRFSVRFYKKEEMESGGLPIDGAKPTAKYEGTRKLSPQCASYELEGTKDYREFVKNNNLKSYVPFFWVSQIEY